MLSPREKYGCKQILEMLSDEDIFALVGPSTNYTIKADSRLEAEDVILSFARSADELLNRKKISKSVLVKYCFTAAIPVSGNYSKPVVIAGIINYWVQAEAHKQASLVVQTPGILDSGQNRNASSSFQGSPVSLANSHQTTIVHNVFNVGSIHETFNQTLNLSPMATLGDTDQNNAESFVKWFYQMLNAHHPNMRSTGESFGPQHFFANAQLFLLMVASAQREEENVVGSENIAQRLVAIPANSHILFNPNVNSQGVTVRSMSHGSKVILVCGTLHLAAGCCGLFQQSFALVSDPLTPGSWKVMVMCLKMDQCAASILPTLTQCQEIHAIEAHTVRALELSATVGLNKGSLS